MDKKSDIRAEDSPEVQAALNALRESEEKYRQLFEIESDALFLVESETGRILDANAAASALYGYSHAELLQLRNVDLSAEAAQTRQATISGTTSIPVRYHRKKDGTVFPVEITATHLTLNGRQVHMPAIRDISDRKKAEEALRLSEEKFSRAFHISPDSININRLKDGLYLEVNQGFLDLTGYTTQEVIGKTSAEINIWERPEDRQRLVQGLLESGEVKNLEALFRIKNGTIKTCLMSARIIEIEGEKCILSITRDISELKRKEQEYTTFVQTSLDGFWCCDFSGRFLDVNEAFCRISGYSRSELLKMDLADIEFSDTPGEIAARVLQVRKTGSARFQTCHRRKDGAIIDVEISTQYVAALGERLFVFIRDITERKLVEKQVNEQLAELRRWYSVTLGRERRILELKNEVNALMAQAGLPPRYPSAE